MKERYIVDTNVLIAASAADPVNPTDIDATPNEPEVRLAVWKWLDTFQRSDSRLVLDFEHQIEAEYNRKLKYGDFGIQVVMSKWDKCAVDGVVVDYDDDGDGILPPSLVPVVHDRADRKMVAAALASYAKFGEGCIAFAGDTDWHDWEGELLEHDVLVEPIIEEWSRDKHSKKKMRK